MAFNPNRWPAADHAVNAAMSALRRGSRVIELSDWELAKTVSTRPALTTDERCRLSSIGVSDEVIRLIANQPPREAQGPDRLDRRPRRG